MTKPSPFVPLWASPPGDTIADLLEERGWTKSDFAKRLDMTPKFVSELLHGKASLSAETAGRLSMVLGSTSEFWLSREAGYRAALERQRAIAGLESHADWLNELPLAWMVRQGWVERVSPKGSQVAACLRWFGVASVEAWRNTYAAPLAAWRASQRVEKKPGAVAAWLRQAELQAAEIPCAPFDAAGFKRALHETRTLTLEPDPEVFVPRLKATFAAQGVAVVFVPAPPGCPISGATKWLTPEKALLALSLRYKSNDHLWFSFFHEGGHLVLHGKKLLFVEGLEGLDTETETEADRFAGDLLIPPHHIPRLQTLRTEAQIQAYAQELGLPPGVLVGRMQHQKWVPHSHLNGLKVRYHWKEEKEQEESEG